MVTDSNLVAVIPYDEIRFRYINNHHDIHLGGLCYYNNNIHYFKCDYPGYNEATEEYDLAYGKIYSLSFKNKIKLLFRQFLFEQCIGHHYSYDRKGNRKTHSFVNRKPTWLYNLLFRKYYDLHTRN